MKKNIILFIATFCSLAMVAQQQKNVLFIAVDDLKPMLGCYGDLNIKTPHIDALAKQSMVFTNAHCQQAVCGPSRASIMTGMRPDYTGVWDLKTEMRSVNPTILTIPEHFKNNGYETVAVGKIYDPRCADKSYDGPSWSIPYAESSKLTYPKEYGEPGLSYYASKENQDILKKLTAEAKAKNIKNVYDYVASRHKPSTEIADVADAAYKDTQITNNSIQYLSKLNNSNKPFFLAVGYARPHLPFTAPKKYWDLYNRDSIQLATYRGPVKNGVKYAYHNMGEMAYYTDIPPLTDFTDIFKKGLPEMKQKELIHGYMACVSYIDNEIGRLMSELKKQGLDKNTTIVLWGDHGFHLGDHSLWCKHSNFEQATRVPLLISNPGTVAGYNASPVEFVDVFPTLCQASGITIPAQLQGKSLMPIVEGKTNKVKEFAVSQFDRDDKEGYSVRNDQYRLTIWLKKNYRTFQKWNPKLVDKMELYDYKNDPLETTNFVKDKKYTSIKTELYHHFVAFVNQQNKEINTKGPQKRWEAIVAESKK